MVPMTVSEFLREENKPGRTIRIDPTASHPFRVSVYSVGETFDVRLTDLPELVDLSKTDQDRARRAATELESDVLWTFVHARLWRDDKATITLFTKMHNVPSDKAWTVDRRLGEHLTLLQDVMTPKPFLAAVAYVNSRLDEIHRRADYHAGALRADAAEKASVEIAA